MTHYRIDIEFERLSGDRKRARLPFEAEKESAVCDRARSLLQQQVTHDLEVQLVGLTTAVEVAIAREPLVWVAVEWLARQAGVAGGLRHACGARHDANGLGIEGGVLGLQRTSHELGNRRVAAQVVCRA
jgi:hypothetical protein